MSAVPAAVGGQAGGEFPHVLDGVVLHGAAARLAARLKVEFLHEAGWDPRSRMLYLPAAHRLLGRRTCRAEGCERIPVSGKPGVCQRCFTRLRSSGMSSEQIATAAVLPAEPARADHCAVPGCQRLPAMRHTELCPPHHHRFQALRTRRSLEAFLASPRIRPLPPAPACAVPACIRPAEHRCGYCGNHYMRWRAAASATPGLDRHDWQQRESGVAEAGQVNLRALPAPVIVQVLFGLQRRTRGGARTFEGDLRALCDTLRRRAVTSITGDQAGQTAPALTTSGRSLLNTLAAYVRRALADPDTEQAKDVWDLAVFGHRGNLSFTAITQPWLREAAKRWASHDLPRHRGSGATRVRTKIHSLGLFSQYLRIRDDRRLDPGALSRVDIEGFLNRLAYLESTGATTRYRRVSACRDVRAVLAGVRALGLTRPGEPAAGLPDDVTITRADIPADPARGPSGRDIPAEIMTMLCANLQTLQPVEVRVAVALGIDTGRRPDEILTLPLDCLSRDGDGAPVLIYHNAKADRLARRLPIGKTTADVITSQQARARQRFPDTPPAELKLLPSKRRNPHGRRAITIANLDERHREWVDALPPLRTSDGTEFDKAKITPYVWRHFYAQRHADAGVGIDVLADLLDHRVLDVTRGYYHIGEDRRRAAVDTVAARSFDRHGNRIWREAKTLLDSEHARYAIGEVAVPYGRCTEPSNVAAGGGACPVRYRCVGCDHFRTDASYLVELRAYLDDLLRTRERLAAAMDGVDDWARLDATPTQEEITRIRRLITRITTDLDDATDTDRATIEQAVTVARRYRAVPLGMPTTRTSSTDTTPEPGPEASV